ncbi:hypothetical protein N5C81_26750 [Rhizobium pusense]|uniref:hypothetical protein n=1 Tax=Agrobacterium pusense TaxID=648995 RepID=UPI00244A6945|nr:hypothetical protein [Agrobacterium pusense]MDH1271206.1 hypothetical protein [Agrobacterium pusense]
MKPSPYHPTRLIGNLAAIVLVALGATYLYDRALRWWGWKSDAFCSTVSFFAPLSFSIGVVLATLGVLIWAVSRFRGEAGIGFMIGGAILSVLPTAMPRYFDWECILTP